jgi:hypothetical protein
MVFPGKPIFFHFKMIWFFPGLLPSGHHELSTIHCGIRVTRSNYHLTEIVFIIRIHAGLWLFAGAIQC